MYRVFVSAVSGELGNCRREVARILRRKELEVRDGVALLNVIAQLLEKSRSARSWIERSSSMNRTAVAIIRRSPEISTTWPNSISPPIDWPRRSR